MHQLQAQLLPSRALRHRARPTGMVLVEPWRIGTRPSSIRRAHTRGKAQRGRQDGVAGMEAVALCLAAATKWPTATSAVQKSLEPQSATTHADSRSRI